MRRSLLKEHPATYLPAHHENPLPATLAPLGNGFHQIYDRYPLGYPGYLFFLEFAPTTAGVPDIAMTFLKDHTIIDVDHSRFMEGYVVGLVQHGLQTETILAAMRVTGNAYARMRDEAVAYSEAPYDVGWNWNELRVDGLRIVNSTFAQVRDHAWQ